MSSLHKLLTAWRGCKQCVQLMHKMHACQVCIQMRWHQNSSKAPPQPLRAPPLGRPACEAGLAAPPRLLLPPQRPSSNNPQMLKTRCAIVPLPQACISGTSLAGPCGLLTCGMQGCTWLVHLWKSIFNGWNFFKGVERCTGHTCSVDPPNASHFHSHACQPALCRVSQVAQSAHAA